MKLPDNENLTAVKEKILPVLKKYRAVLAVLLAGVLLLTSGHSGNTEQVQTASTDTTVSQSFEPERFFNRNWRRDFRGFPAPDA